MFPTNLTWGRSMLVPRRVCLWCITRINLKLKWIGLEVRDQLWLSKPDWGRSRLSRFLDSNFEPIAHAYQESHHMSYTNIIQISDYCILDLYDVDYFGVFAKTSKIFKRDASWSLALLESRLSTIVPLKKRSWNPKQTVFTRKFWWRTHFPSTFFANHPIETWTNHLSMYISGSRNPWYFPRLNLGILGDCRTMCIV